MRTATFFTLALLAAGAAHAQQVYRCGNTYGQQPCEGASVVKVDDARTPGQAAAATAETSRAQKAADAMEKARVREEAKAAPASVMQHTKSETAQAPEPKPKEIQPHAHAKKKGKKPEYFTAVAPKKPVEKSAMKKAGPKKKAA